MTALISFPFRLTPRGDVVTRDDGSDEYSAELIALLVQTHPGERELVPTYGVNDPTFAAFDRAALTAQVAAFGPQVVIDSVETRVVSGEHLDVVVAFRASPDSSGQPATALADPEEL